MTTKKETCNNLYRRRSHYNASGLIKDYVYLLDANATKGDDYWRYAQYLIIGEEGVHYMSVNPFFEVYELVKDA